MSAVSDIEQQICYLRAAELQFRLSSAVRLATTFKVQPRDLPMQWSHGKHVVADAEVAISEEDADCAACFLHRSATFLMAVAIKDAIRAAVPDPKNHFDSEIRSAYQISRLIRNAFAHAPFAPVWSIDSDCRNQVYAVRALIRLDTTGLQNHDLIGDIMAGRLPYCDCRSLCEQKFLRINSPHRQLCRSRKLCTSSRAT